MSPVPFLKPEKLYSKDWWFNYARLLLGAIIMALGYVLFIVPYNIVPGGVYGVAIILHAFYGLPVGTTGLIMNIPLLIWGIKELGPRFGAKTVVGLVLVSGLIDLFTYWYGSEPLTKDVLMSSVFGGIFIGVGLGLIFQSKATTAGSDIVAQIMNKRLKFPLGQALILIDTAVVTLGIVAFKDVTLALYAVVTIVVTGKVIDMVMSGLQVYKSTMIVTSRPEELKARILYSMVRGGTFFQAEGMYSGKPWRVIFCTLTRREMVILQEHVREVDPNAFMTVFDSSEVLGEGFKALLEEPQPGEKPPA